MKGKIEELSTEELEKSLIDSRNELRKQRFSAVTSKLENPKKIREIKRHIARILTIKNEYKLGIAEKKVK